MTRYVMRREPSSPEKWTAALIGLGLGAAAFVVGSYVARLYLAREELEALPPRESHGTGPDGRRAVSAKRMRVLPKPLGE